MNGGPIRDEDSWRYIVDGAMEAIRYGIRQSTVTICYHADKYYRVH